MKVNEVYHLINNEHAVIIFCFNCIRRDRNATSNPGLRGRITLDQLEMNKRSFKDWTSRENSLELIELSSINVLHLIFSTINPLGTWDTWRCLAQFTLRSLHFSCKFQAVLEPRC